jgi:hypothetical protein
MHDIVVQARTASSDPKDCRRTIDALQAMGFAEDAFRLLHHLNDTAARFYSYSERIERFEEDGNNHRVHQRLMYVLLLCPDGAPPKGKSFQTLAEEAYRQIPRARRTRSGRGPRSIRPDIHSPKHRKRKPVPGR